LRTSLNQADALEHALLHVSEEDWKKWFKVSQIRVTPEGGIVTGDPVLDRWDREMRQAVKDREEAQRESGTPEPN